MQFLAAVFAIAFLSFQSAPAHAEDTTGATGQTGATGPTGNESAAIEEEEGPSDDEIDFSGEHDATDTRPAAPQLGPIRMTRAGGLIGGNDQGFGVGGSLEVAGADGILEGSVGRIDLVAGFPALRLSGSAEVIPIRATRVEIGSTGRFEVILTPVTADFQTTIPNPTLDNPGRHHLVISPQAAAQLGLEAGPVRGTVRLRTALGGGVAGDGDGAGGVLNWQTGFDANLSYRVNDSVELEAGFSLTGSLSLLDAAGVADHVTGSGVSRVSGYAGANFRIPTGEVIYTRVEGTSNRHDVLSGGASGSDDGRSTGVFGVVGIAF